MRRTALTPPGSCRARLSVPTAPLLALLALAVGGCDQNLTFPAAPPPDASVHVRLNAQISGSTRQITGVSLHVAGSGIEQPLVLDLGVPDSLGRTASVDADLPAGPDRVFHAYAYTRHVLTHHAADTVDVTRAGLQLRMDLRKFPGNAPYSGPPREFVLKMDDSSTVVEDTDTIRIPPGGERVLTAELTAQSAMGSVGLLAGDPIPDTPISWGVADPDPVQLSGWICITGSTGQCSIRVFVSADASTGSEHLVFAASGGVADRMLIVVE